MVNGTVKFYNRVKRFGFVTGDDGQDYFVHQSGIEGSGTLNEGDKVSFDVTEGDRGPKAEHVKKL